MLHCQHLMTWHYLQAVKCRRYARYPDSDKKLWRARARSHENARVYYYNLCL
jgi:hypothetical protein